MATVAFWLVVGVASAAFVSVTGNAGSSLQAAVLDPPTSLDAIASGGDVQLDWTATPDTWAAGYEVWRSSTPGCCYVFHDTVVGQPTISYTDVGAGAGAYSYVLRSELMN